MVALKDVNAGEIEDMLRWCHGESMDLTLIETMPLGEIEGDRTDQYLPLGLPQLVVLAIQPRAVTRRTRVSRFRT